MRMIAADRQKHSNRSVGTNEYFALVTPPTTQRNAPNCCVRKRLFVAIVVIVKLRKALIGSYGTIVATNEHDD